MIRPPSGKRALKLRLIKATQSVEIEGVRIGSDTLVFGDIHHVLEADEGGDAQQTDRRNASPDINVKRGPVLIKSPAQCAP